MSAPYESCATCTATPFCGKYNGTVEITDDSPFCSSLYRLNAALKLSHLPPYLQKANLYNFIVDDANRKAYEEVKKFVDNIVSRVESGANFLMYGQGTGTGKTFSAAVIANHYIYKTCLTKKMDFETPLSLFVEYSTLIDNLRYRREDDEVVDLTSKIRKAPLLLLDDVGAGTLSDFAREQTYIILNYRMNHQLSTIVTTNLGSKQLEQDNILGKRNVSRIMNNCFGCMFGGEDRRRL